MIDIFHISVFISRSIAFIKLIFYTHSSTADFQEKICFSFKNDQTHRYVFIRKRAYLRYCNNSRVFRYTANIFCSIFLSENRSKNLYWIWWPDLDDKSRSNQSKKISKICYFSVRSFYHFFLSRMVRGKKILRLWKFI